jgi:hypothetical protein
MNKKVYQSPEVTIVLMNMQSHLMQASGESAHSDDPQNPSSSMSRYRSRGSRWDDDWDDEDF